MKNLQKINTFISEKQKYLNNLSTCINYLNNETNNSFINLKEYLPLDVVEKRNLIVLKYNEVVENVQKIINKTQDQNIDESKLVIEFDYRKNLIEKLIFEISHTTQLLYNQHFRNLKRASKQKDIIKDIKNYQALIPQLWLSYVKINTNLNEDSSLERKLTTLFYFPMYKFDLGGKTKSNFGSFLTPNCNVLIEKEIRDDFNDCVYPFTLSINLIFNSESIFIFNKGGRFDNSDGTFKSESEGTKQLTGEEMFNLLKKYHKSSKGEYGFLVKEVIDENKVETQHPKVKETTPLDIITHRANKLSPDQTQLNDEKIQEQVNDIPFTPTNNSETLLEKQSKQLNSLKNPNEFNEEEFNEEELLNENSFVTTGDTLKQGEKPLSPKETIQLLKKEKEEQQKEIEKLKKQKEIREKLLKQSSKPIKVTTKKKEIPKIQTHKNPIVQQPSKQVEEVTKDISLSPTENQGSLVGVGLKSKQI